MGAWLTAELVPEQMHRQWDETLTYGVVSKKKAGALSFSSRVVPFHLFSFRFIFGGKMLWWRLLGICRFYSCQVASHSLLDCLGIEPWLSWSHFGTIAHLATLQSFQAMSPPSPEFMDSVYEKLQDAYDKKKRRGKARKRRAYKVREGGKKTEMCEKVETLQWFLFMEANGYIGHYRLWHV